MGLSVLLGRRSASLYSLCPIHDVMGFVADDTKYMLMTLSLGLFALSRCSGRNCLTTLTLRIRRDVLTMW